MRDVGDIGMRRFTPFITDSSTEIPLPNGAALKTATAAKQKTKEMQSMIQQGNLGRYRRCLYYLQPASDGGPKRNRFDETFLRKMAPNAILNSG